MGRRFKREGTYVYLRLIHIEVWQKTTKFCKAIILQLKKKKIRVLDPDSPLPMQRSRQLQSGLWCLLLVDNGKGTFRVQHKSHRANKSQGSELGCLG